MKLYLRILNMFVLLITFTSGFSQSKMQYLYDSKKFMKCLFLCDQNIQDKIDEQEAYYFKSLILLENKNDQEILKVYPNPLYEVLKTIARMEKYKSKYPNDAFYKEHHNDILTIIKGVSGYADAFYYENKRKEYLALYDKLYSIYPDNKTYLYKIALGYRLNYTDFSLKYATVSEDEFNKLMLDIAENTKSLFPDNDKQILLDALNELYNSSSVDLQIISQFLVNLNKTYPDDSETKELLSKFRQKHWQIDMLLLVNDKRAEGTICGDKEHKPMEPLYLSNCLTRASQKYAEVLFKENHFSHTSPDGKSPWKRAEEEGCSADGENIAMGNNRPIDTLNQWMNSPGHCSNIMGYHKYMGIGESGTYWVQMFQ